LPCQLCTCYVPASETTQVVTSPPRIAFREREESARLRGEKARRERKRNTAVRYARISAICALIALAKDQDLRSGIQYVVNLGQQIGAVGTNVANQPKGTDQPKDGLVAESGSGSSPEPRVTDLSIGTAATIQLDQHLGLSNTSIVSPVGTLTAVVDPIRFDQSLGLNAGILSSPVNLSIGTAGNSSIFSQAGTLTAAIDPIRLDRPLGLGAASILSSAPALSIGDRCNDPARSAAWSQQYKHCLSRWDSDRRHRSDPARSAARSGRSQHSLVRACSKHWDRCDDPARSAAWSQQCQHCLSRWDSDYPRRSHQSA
jgi:hypothetical protein